MKIKATFAVLFGLLLNTLVQAHDHAPLPHGTLLGVLPVPGNVAGSNEIVIDTVVPGSTGEVLGLNTGDVLKQVNGVRLKDFSHLVALIQSYKVGKTLNVKIMRKDKEVQLSGSLQGRPRETSVLAEVSYDTVYVPGGRLRSIVYNPRENKGPSPAVFFIQGYTCGSVDDGMFPQSSTRQMVEQWVKAGLVVYKVEKYAVGESQTEKHCSEIGFDREVEGFLAGLKALKQYDFVDPEQIYLFGHSLGVLVAPIVAKQNDVAGISGYGGVVKQWDEYLLDIYSDQAVKHFGVAKSEAERDRRTVEPFIELWLNSDKDLGALQQTTAYKRVVNGNLMPINGDQFFHRHYSFFREVNQHNFRNLWAQLKVPTLMMHGSLDIQAIDASWAHEIADIVNEASTTPLAEAVVIENAEHAFMHYPSARAYREARGDRSYRPSQAGEQYEEAIGQQVIDWIKRTRASSADA